MDYVHIVLTSVGSVVALFVFTKLMGNKQMSQLNMFDYINGITIGSIAAEMATSEDDSWRGPLIAMTIYTAAALLITFLTAKSVAMRRLLTGKAIILLDNGKLYKQNFKKARIDLNEFLTECRISGFFDLSDIQTAVLEPNGHISILPKSTSRPANPADMNLSPKPEYAVINVIVDGKVLSRNLKTTGHDEKWLRKNLKNQGYKSYTDVFLATCDASDNLSIYPRDTVAPNGDIFQ
ncbi:MAG: DUF421 domain-containing protein [Eubacteriales bacterium]